MSKKDKKPSTRTLAKEAIANKYKNDSQSPPLIVSANLPNNKTGFAAVSSNSIETFQYNKEKDELTLIGTYNLSDYSEVYVDHFAMKSEFKFQVLEKNPFYFIPTEKGKEVESLIKNYTSIEIHNIERKWYKKILGFRSGKKWKMIVASLVYLFILSAVINGMTNNKPSTTTSETNTSSSSSGTLPETKSASLNNDFQPKHKPEVIAVARKGGLGDTFDQLKTQFGDPNRTNSKMSEGSGQYNYQDDNQVVIYTEGRVSNITYQLDHKNNIMSEKQAEDFALTMIPSDSTFIKQYDKDDNTRVLLYHSKTLELLFDPNEFKDANGNVQLGQFDIVLTHNGDEVDSMGAMTGDNP